MKNKVTTRVKVIESLSIALLRPSALFSITFITSLCFLLLSQQVKATQNNMIVSPINSNGCPITLDFKLRKLAETEEINLCETYKGKVVLIVNTASKCGFTDQFDGLESLYKKYKDKGLVVLGFPSNDFANQDPENEKKIAEFCRLTYSVKFPMFQKIHVAENNASPIYKTLGKLAGEFPKWNFHKYLLDTKGNLIASFPSRVEPNDRKLVASIKKLLP